MEVFWTSSAHTDLVRIHEFLIQHNPRSAHRVIQHIIGEAKNLRIHPFIGSALLTYVPRNVRQLFIGDYELRYEVTDTELYILRVWHTKEQRSN